MKRKKNTFSFISVISFAVFFLAAFVFLQSKQSANPEPLADAVSLSHLIAGDTLPKPSEEHYGQFHGITVTPPALTALKQTSRVLGVTSVNDKRIEVDLARQHVYAFEGNRKVFDFIVSTGKWGKTPTGTFHIWAKVKSQLMTGGSGADYYYLPNIPWVQFFYNDDVPKSRGFSFHGTYWHHNFGHPMSHGCINMQSDEAGLLFNWTTPVVTNPAAWSTNATADNPGTEVVIYGEPPEE